MTQLFRLKNIALFSFLLLLIGCSSLKDTVEPPQELSRIQPEYSINILWRKSVGESNKEGLQLRPVMIGDAIYTADPSGLVRAIDKQKGSILWTKRLKLDVLSAMGGNEKSLFLTTDDGVLYALNRSTGAVVWQYLIGAAVLAPPVANESVVLIKTVDGQLVCISTVGGELIWRNQSSVPDLVLRESSSPVIDGNNAFVGMDNGRIMAVSLINGKVAWEIPVSFPQGNTDLEQMRDVDAEPLIDSGIIYGAAYQGRVVALSYRSARTIWAVDRATHRNMAVDNVDGLILSDDGSKVLSIDKTKGVINWEQIRLRGRKLTAPSVVDSGVILVGDYQGYIHGLDELTGRLVARKKLSSGAYRQPMIVEGDVVYALDSKSNLTAFAIKKQND